jgi:3D (Asp-Asp-Asp) domain-containing protein
MKKFICAAAAALILMTCAAPVAASAMSAHVENTESVVAKAAAIYRGKKKTGVRVTYYCACPSCNGYWSSWRNGAWSTVTASGKRLYNKKSYKYKYCAATPAVGKLGQTVSIYLDGKWRKLKIVDRLGSNSGKKIDVFLPSHRGCYSHGVIRSKTVYVK